jgi:hypothetical protein
MHAVNIQSCTQGMLKGIQQVRLFGPHPLANREWAQYRLECKNPSSKVRGFWTSRPQSMLLLAQTTCPEAQAPVRRSPPIDMTLFDPCLLTRGPDIRTRAARESRCRAAVAAHEFAEESADGVTLKKPAHDGEA